MITDTHVVSAFWLCCRFIKLLFLMWWSVPSVIGWLLYA